jgi:predicted metal-dependent hydrolase
MENQLMLIVMLLTIAACVMIFSSVAKTEVTYIQSAVDDQKYRVLDREDKQEAADFLANLRKNIFYLESHLHQNIDKFPKQAEYIEQLHRRIQNVILSENTPDSSYTSYSVEKGEEMVFCLRSNRIGQLHDMNLLMYVALHEMSHVACPSEQHNPPFYDIFIFLQKEAINLGIYKHMEYDINPHEYCGVTLKENLLRDK